jgi:prepilin-type N-terminal cleavage/methylation domain-containing protein
MHAKKGFTLIELLVVIAIIAILAAILFPVFARAREKARQTSCLSNIKELALGTLMYAQDYDEVHSWWDRNTYDETLSPFYPARAIYPYVKNLQIFACPSGADIPGGHTTDPNTWNQYHDYHTPGPVSLGYGWNDYIFGASQSSPLKMALVRYPAGTLMVSDSVHMFGGRGAVLWANVCCDGPGGWSGAAPLDGFHGDGTPSTADDSRHNGGENHGFMDGHAKWLASRTVFGNWQGYFYHTQTP